jgi:hypothetical protein
MGKVVWLFLAIYGQKGVFVCLGCVSGVSLFWPCCLGSGGYGKLGKKIGK